MGFVINITTAIYLGFLKYPVNIIIDLKYNEYIIYIPE